jgi:hypothetical protein
MGTIQPTQPRPNFAKGTTRQFEIRSCSLRTEDLRRLYKILDARATEFASQAVGMLRQLPDQTDEQFKQVKENATSLLRLVVIVNASTGDWISSSSDEALCDASLPASIANIVYDSGFLFRGQVKLEPQNYFKVVVDFSRTQILDLTNLWTSPSSNTSSVLITGTNDTWVKAVHDDLRNFFDERATLRGWLYSRYTYDVLVWTLGIPTSLALVYHIDKWTKLTANSPGAVRVPLYVALFLLVLLIFRFLFNYAKWAFPKIESPTVRGLPVLHRSLLAVIWASVVSILLESIARIIHLI